MNIKRKIRIMCLVMILAFLSIANPQSAETETGQVTRREAVSALEQGRRHYNRGDYHQAIQEYNEFMKLVPGKADAHYRRGMAYDKLGDFNRAIQDYDRAIEINPKHVEAYNNRGVIYGKLGNKKREIADYAKAADLNQQSKVGKPMEIPR